MTLLNHYSLPIKLITALKYVLLDMFAIFDRVDHNVLFSGLKYMFGLSCKVLDWFRSYLEQRSQKVYVHDTLSDVQFLLSGLPQGSDLGPLLFTMYNRPLGIIRQRCSVRYYVYADDTHWYTCHWYITMG